MEYIQQFAIHEEGKQSTWAWLSNKHVLPILLAHWPYSYSLVYVHGRSVKVNTEQTYINILG